MIKIYVLKTNNAFPLYPQKTIMSKKYVRKSLDFDESILVSALSKTRKKFQNGNKNK